MHVEVSLAANLCLITSLSPKQCSQYERFCVQHVQMVNKTCNFKTKMIGNNADASRVNAILIYV